MKVVLIAYDSFSTRSMATLVITDTQILIDPSVAIAPKRYNLPPHPIELEELKSKKEELINLAKNVEHIVITHYHWDHCPNPNEPHFKILHGKTLYLKHPKEYINNSQKTRAREVLSNIKNSTIFFADSKSFEIDNTYIEFSYPVWHGPYKSVTGYVIMVYISYKNKSLVFASDVQGVLTEEAKSWIIDKNPDLLILSGPAIYLPFWDKDMVDLSLSNLKDIIEATNIKEIVIDHHLTRSIEYKKFVDSLNAFAEQYNVKAKTAADFMGYANRLLEARRKDLYKKINKQNGNR